MGKERVEGKTMRKRGPRPHYRDSLPSFKYGMAVSLRPARHDSASHDTREECDTAGKARGKPPPLRAGLHPGEGASLDVPDALELARLSLLLTNKSRGGSGKWEE
jgi:hypothetical protein